MSNHTADDRGEGGVAGAEAWLSDRGRSRSVMTSAEVTKFAKQNLKATKKGFSTRSAWGSSPSLAQQRDL